MRFRRTELKPQQRKRTEWLVEFLSEAPSFPLGGPSQQEQSWQRLKGNEVKKLTACIRGALRVQYERCISSASTVLQGLTVFKGFHLRGFRGFFDAAEDDRVPCERKLPI